MNIATDAIDMLWRLTWTGSLAILVVLLLRAPVRRRFGAGTAYMLWWLPVATWLAQLLPARTMEVPVFAALEPVASGAASVVLSAPASAPFDIRPLGLALWLLGACAMFGLLCWQQRRFERGLGRMQAIDGERRAWRAEGAEGLPAVIGLLRPRIILPADIDTRFDSEQRRLMLAHEGIHLRRGDAWANALAALARSVFWFNPLVHAAASRMRHDQELACDARVIAAHPHARRAYGEAMLKNAASPLMMPLGCHWGVTHPMKERVMLLKSAIPPRGTRLAGALMVGAAALAVAAAAWAAMPPRQVERRSEVEVRSDGHDFQADITVSIDGASASDMTIIGGYGKPFSVQIQDNQTGALDLQGTVTQTKTDKGLPAYRIQTRLLRDGKLLGQPGLVVAPDKDARIRIGEQSAAGAFAGIEMKLRIGAVSKRAKQAMRDADEAAANAIVAAEAADQAAKNADRAAMDAEKAAEAAVGTAAEQARIAADQASKAADAAAGAAAEAAIHEAEAQGERQRIERRIIIRNDSIASPPAPPAPPAVPGVKGAPPAPLAPPMPPALAASGKAVVHIERQVRNGPARPAPPTPPAPPTRIDSAAKAVAAGGRELTPAEVKAAGLKSGYRWVDVQSLVAGQGALSIMIEADVVTVQEEGEGPHYAGYKP